MNEALSFLLTLFTALKASNESKPIEPLEYIIQETNLPSKSADTFWWLNSGARVTLKENYIKTLQGSLSENDHWRVLYNKTSSYDTNDGYYPQNLLRLVSLKKYVDSSTELYFKINKLNLINSLNRNQSNGVLIMSNYIDGDNLYYAGVRVDGQAVIKRKANGVYTTLSAKKIFEGSYDRATNPNLIPVDTWIGLKSILTKKDNVTTIELLVKQDEEKEWESVFSFRDSYSWSANEGSVGVRSDFMDIEFRDIIIL